MVDSRLKAPEVHALVGNAAREAVTGLVKNGRASPIYQTFVDGVEGANENDVKLDGGRIYYLFDQSVKLQEAVAYGLAYVKQISPRRTGRYSNLWYVAVNGTPYTGRIADIPPDSVVMILNFADYARILEEGGRTGRSGRLKNHKNPATVITELGRQRIQRQFPTVQVERRFVSVPGAYIRKTPPTGPITYPAIVLSEKIFR